MKFNIYLENQKTITIEAIDILTAQEEAVRIAGYPGKVTKITKLIPLTCCSNHCEYCGSGCRDDGTPVELVLEENSVQSELFETLITIDQFNFSHRTSRYILGLNYDGSYRSIDQDEELFEKIEECVL